ncbi:MAG: hypothetical protein JWL76_2275 [Thermoleophilia bacterium]|nr:hypothetical protein [Thermoleophilia bacterium]
MPIEIVGTRVDEANEATAYLTERLAVDQGTGVAIASAYWDASSFETAADLAARIRGRARLLLWAGGGTNRDAWDALEASTGKLELEIVLVGSPERGSFHAKVFAVEGESERWNCALVGSANFTDAGLTRNVELGVLIQNEHEPLSRLREWFEATWATGEVAEDAPIDQLRGHAPINFEESDRSRFVAAAQLLHEVHAGEPVSLRRLGSTASDTGAPHTLRACHGREGAILRRLDVVIGRIAGDEPNVTTVTLGRRKFPGKAMRRIHLTHERDRVQLRMWPADILDQARHFYRDPAAVQRVLALRVHGWEMRPNFHWGNFQTGYVHTWPMPGTRSLEGYADYWMERFRDEHVGQLEPDRFHAELDRLVADGIVDENHRSAFRLEFEDFEHANPCPGIGAWVSWEFGDAVALDDDGAFVEAVRVRVNEMLVALGEKSFQVPGSSRV